jgi:hypothetical protein
MRCMIAIPAWLWNLSKRLTAQNLARTPKK